MHDNNPAKLLLCARDVLTGVMLPWYLRDEHRTAIGELRTRIEVAAAQKCLSQSDISALLSDCVDLASDMSADAANVKNFYGKLDRGRLILACILEVAIKRE